MWWYTPLIPALGRQRGTNLWEFKDSLVYRGNSRTKICREPVSKSQKLKVKIKEIEVKIKPCKDGENTENLDTVYYYAFFELFEC